MSTGKGQPRMRRAGYIAGTTLLGGLIGAIFGAIWGFFAQEIGWWGAWMILGLVIGIVGGVAVAGRMEPSAWGTSHESAPTTGRGCGPRSARSAAVSPPPVAAGRPRQR